MRTFFLLLAALLAFPAYANEFKVREVNGVPQILLNGKSIPARFLFVCKTAQENVTLKPQWQDFEMVYLAAM